MNPFAQVLGQILPTKRSTARPALATSVPVSVWPAPAKVNPLTLRKGGTGSTHPLPPLAVVNNSAHAFVAPGREDAFALPRPVITSGPIWSAPSPKPDALTLRREAAEKISREFPRPPAPAERQVCRTC